MGCWDNQYHDGTVHIHLGNDGSYYNGDIGKMAARESKRLPRGEGNTHEGGIKTTVEMVKWNGILPKNGHVYSVERMV